MACREVKSLGRGTAAAPVMVGERLLSTDFVEFSIPSRGWSAAADHDVSSQMRPRQTTIRLFAAEPSSKMTCRRSKSLGRGTAARAIMVGESPDYPRISGSSASQAVDGRPPPTMTFPFVARCVLDDNDSACSPAEL